MIKIIQETHANIIEAFHKYKSYYDRKAKVTGCTFLFIEKLTSLSGKVPFIEIKLEGPYKVVKSFQTPTT